MTMRSVPFGDAMKLREIIDGWKAEGRISADDHRTAVSLLADAQEARKALIKECAEIAAKAIFSHPKVEGYRDVIRDPSKGELVRAVRGALDELAASQLPEGMRASVPWKGRLSVDLRKGALRVNADGVTLIDEAGVCWAIVFPDKTGSYDHAGTIVDVLSSPSSVASTDRGSL